MDEQRSRETRSQAELALDLSRVERALEALSFKPGPNEDGWRWRGPIDGVPVKLEFLCDLPDYREGEMISPTPSTP